MDVKKCCYLSVLCVVYYNLIKYSTLQKEVFLLLRTS